MENMEDLEWIEKFFRKELKPDETARFHSRLAADPEFKRKFETESLVHKGLQFSQVREAIKAYSINPVPMAIRTNAQWLDNKTFMMVGGTALAVWIFSTFSSSLTSLPPENIKWVGLGLAVVGWIGILAIMNKTMNLRLGMLGFFFGILVFVTASGIDAINQGVGTISGKVVDEANLVPYTENKPWWPTQSLQDSLEGNRKQILEMQEQIRTLVSSRINSRFNMNFTPGVIPVVIPRSITVPSGSIYEADIFFAAALRQPMEMRVGGKSIPMVTDSDGVRKGKVSFTATADQFDKTGMARKKFVAEIKLGDSIYTKVVEYHVVKPK